MPARTASIVVNNYNYASYLREAIDSALAQTYAHTEVIVVDDGSTDTSRQIIESYGGRIRPTFKPNGGQASAFNAGFAAANGDVVLFLDSDDVLEPDAIAGVMRHFEQDECVKVQWPLVVVDAAGRRTGQLFPAAALAEGDLREHVFERGPDIYLWPPTSGNVWRRAYLEQIFPVPEAIYKRGADTYLMMLAPFYGTIRNASRPLSFYRRHGSGGWWSMDFDARMRRELWFYDNYASKALEYCASRGIAADALVWQANSWLHKLEHATADLARVVPTGSRFVLIDDATWGMRAWAGREAIPFTERDGEYFGPPADDAQAVAELERLTASGAAHVVVAWPCFWWLDHYREFSAHLDCRFQSVMSNERVVVYVQRARS
ncbi:MAG: hypothetical protein JWQ07_5866 [Ramlibacter sp.]|nr:hypothetical protein [Ramlibacter sp.]